MHVMQYDLLKMTFGAKLLCIFVAIKTLGNGTRSSELLGGCPNCRLPHSTRIDLMRIMQPTGSFIISRVVTRHIRDL